MAVVFVFIALILIIAGVRGETQRVTDTLKSDINYSMGHASQFGMWIVVMLVLSAVGSWKPVRPVTDAFIVLIILVFLLKNRGFFAKFMAAFQ